MRFEWDAGKANENLATHGVSFDEAATVFGDVLASTVGVSSNGRRLTVAHTDRSDTIRMISARLMTPGERTLYEEG